MRAPAASAPTHQDEMMAGGSGVSMPFEGFDPPESNFWRLPNDWFDLAARFTSWAEHKVVEYILRHTWGYQEYGVAKLITMDEFMHGRKRRDGSRLDAGCGMAENSIKKGIADAVAHGFLIVETDDSDRGRIKKYYAPRMRRPFSDEGEHAAHTTPSAARREAHRSASVDGPGFDTIPRRAPGELSQAGGQSLTLPRQELTPEGHALNPEGPALPPVEQRVTLMPHILTPSRVSADPRTGKTPPAQHHMKDTVRQHVPVGSLPAPEHATEPLSLVGPAASTPPALQSAQQSDLAARLVAEGITPTKARLLVRSYAEERIIRQLEWIDGRACQNRPATLVAAIERDYSAPAPRRPSGGDSGPFDRSKFYRGSYAICPQCGSRPCVCDAPRAAAGSRR